MDVSSSSVEFENHGFGRGISHVNFCLTHFCTSVVPQLLLINSNESVAFECFRPGNVQNPSDVYFNEVQFAVSFVLEMEYKVYFSVKIENFVWRTVFRAGITTVHWFEL